MKIFKYYTFQIPRSKYGIIIAESEKEAREIVKDSNNIGEFIQIDEIPMEKGHYEIASYVIHD